MKQRVRWFALALALALAPMAASAQEWNHNPESDAGPKFWGSVSFPFAICGSQFDPVVQAEQPAVVEVGKKQTPVDILPANTIAALLAPLLFAYGSTPFEVENTGHVVETPYVPGSFLLVGLDRYELLQFHFHAPSEHTVNGQAADMELHLVHRDVLGNLAVVGVMLKVGAPPNRLLDDIIAASPLTEGTQAIEGRTISARNVLPGSTSFYTYTGSLTTPPCTEGVRWFVLKNPVLVSQGTVDRLHQIIGLFPGYEGYGNNNRPTRPLNGRSIQNQILR